MDFNLLEKTLDYAKRTKYSVKDICSAIHVTERWYYKLLSGEIKNPGVKHVQNLHNLLAAEAGDEARAAAEARTARPPDGRPGRLRPCTAAAARESPARQINGVRAPPPWTAPRRPAAGVPRGGGRGVSGVPSSGRRGGRG